MLCLKLSVAGVSVLRYLRNRAKRRIAAIGGHLNVFESKPRHMSIISSPRIERRWACKASLSLHAGARRRSSKATELIVKGLNVKQALDVSAFELSLTFRFYSKLRAYV